MKLYAFLIKITLLMGLGVWGQSNALAGTNELEFTQLDDQLRAIIKDIHSSDSNLLEAISHLGRPTEGPAFWTKIANDTNYTMLHRTRCVFALFRRYAIGEVAVESIGQSISPATWLESSEIVKLDPNDLRGPQDFPGPPVDANDGDTVFRINVLNSYKHIYLRFKGDVSMKEFISELKWTPKIMNYVEVTNSQSQTLIVAQMGFDDGYDEWYNNSEN